MPRNTKGMPMKGVDVPEDEPQHAEMLSEHRDRLERIEKHLGITHKADDMKSEDQGGKTGKPNAGHVTERKRH